MKKLILIGSLASLFSSCKKSYQCDCSVYDSTGVYLSTKSYTYKDKERSAAQASCIANSNVTQAQTTKCGLVN